MKLYAFYLPQFHRTKENDEWWGEGFTEWTNIRNSKSLYNNHNQPRIPLNNNYYDLLDIEVMRWQANLAKEYHIDGFCVYHYWFDGKMLLNKPMENLLNNKDIDFPFMFCWANETWTNAWATNDRHPKVLMNQTYGDENEWERHFKYLLPFFKDNRYLKKDNKPIVVFYRPENITRFNERVEYYRKRLVEEGFDGGIFISQQKDIYLGRHDTTSLDYMIEYQPGLGEYYSTSACRHMVDKVKQKIIDFAQEKLDYGVKKVRGLYIEDYDKIWQSVLSIKPKNNKMIPGAFVDWDNTPRYGNKGFVIQGACPEKFEKYFREQYSRAKNVYKKECMFIFAWNEWAEGGYLEPDEKYKDGYLNAIKKIVEEQKDNV